MTKEKENRPYHLKDYPHSIKALLLISSTIVKVLAYKFMAKKKYVG